MTPRSHLANSSAMIVLSGLLITVFFEFTDAPRAYRIESLRNILTELESTSLFLIALRGSQSFIIGLIRVENTSLLIALVGKTIAAEKPEM